VRHGPELTCASIRGIRPYNGDAEEEGIPQPVTFMKEAIIEADGLLLVTPE
jgi:NAD(P)H-dependent FMN reductase